MKFLCRHKWDLLKETITKSKLEVAMEATKGRKKVEIPHQLADTTQKTIQILSCSKCGKIRKFVTEN